jgi:hypothetical protein
MSEAPDVLIKNEGENFREGLQIERNREKEHLIQEFYGSSEYTGLMTNMQTRKDLHSNLFLGEFTGKVFEQMALNYYYKKINPNPEARSLAFFLQAMLVDYKNREIDFYQDWGETPVSMLIFFPGNRKPVGNPDALLVDIKSNKNTGKKVATIVGALDAKLQGRVHNKQLTNFRDNLISLVGALKPHYQKLIQQLDLAEPLPEDIDIVSPDIFKIKTIQPQGSPRATYAKRSSGAKFVIVPITRAEVEDIVHAMISDTLAKRV